MSAALPILDLFPFIHPSISTREAKLAAAAALDAACTTHGFFYLTNHGIAPALQAQVLALARHFFLQPLAAKATVARPAGGARGYQQLGENVTQGRRDQHEAIDFYSEGAGGAGVLAGPNRWPEGVPGFRVAFEAFWAQLRALGDAVMRAMAWALGYEAAEDVLARCTRDGYWVARVIGYPPLRAPEGGGVSCGVHTGAFCARAGGRAALTTRRLRVHDVSARG